MTPLRVYLGWDDRELAAYLVARNSAVANSSAPVCVNPLILDELQKWGHSTRRYNLMHKAAGQVLWDSVSEAPCSTQFANTRFMVPRLALGGWALFMDSDVVVHGDLAELFALADPKCAVMCVKHSGASGAFGGGSKMDGQAQTYYHRKNWSSVMLWNCSHPSNHCLTHEMLNATPGRDLHRFFWLADEEIGTLPPEWNWLVGIQERPAAPKIAHYTLGGPWLSGWSGGPHDSEWLDAKAHFGTGD